MWLQYLKMYNIALLNCFLIISAGEHNVITDLKSLNTKSKTVSFLIIDFLHSVIFIDWMYWDRLGPENTRVDCVSVCVSVCLCVCLSVCLCRAVSQNYWAELLKTL